MTKKASTKPTSPCDFPAPSADNESFYILVSEENQKLRKEVLRLLDRNAQLTANLEDALSQKNERELALKQDHDRFNNREDLVKNFVLLMASLTNKIAGKEVVKITSSLFKETTASLLNSLNEEQFSKIAATLTPEQQTIFLDIYTACVPEEKS